ncbi:hypothetical protein EV127DRAFT_466928 [Xylaria flabelliformis]|nr:hypothetical protein EV127DRAFT_466928 [Xylaria flabelliformis]
MGASQVTFEVENGCIIVLESTLLKTNNNGYVFKTCTIHENIGFLSLSTDLVNNGKKLGNHCFSYYKVKNGWIPNLSSLDWLSFILTMSYAVLHLFGAYDFGIIDIVLTRRLTMSYG